MSDRYAASAPDLLDTPAAGRAAIRGGVARGGGYVLGLLLSVASVPLVVRHLGVAEFGRFVLVTALITVVAGISEGGLQAVGVREFATRAPAERDRLMRNLLGVRLALTGAGVVGAMTFAVLAGYDQILVAGVALAGAGLLVQSVQSLLIVPLAADLRLGWVTITDLARQALAVTLTVALVLAGATLLPFFAVALPAGVLALALTVVLVRGATPFRPAFDPREWWLLIRDTIPYAAAIAINVAYFRIAIVLMSLLAVELETGYFAASFRVLEVLLPVPALVVGAVFPILARAARDDRARLRYASQRIFETSLLAGVGLVVVLEVGAPTIMAVLAGDAGKPAVEILRLQAPAIAFTFAAMACGYPLLSMRRHRALLTANLVALAASVTLCIALIPGSGAAGAAVATTVAELGLAVVNFWLLRRAGGGVGLSARAATTLALAATAGLLTLLLPVPNVAQAAIAGGLYLGILTVLGRIPRELVDAARRRQPALSTTSTVL